MAQREWYSIGPSIALPEGFLTERARYEIRFSIDGACLPSNATVLVNDIECPRVDRRGESLVPIEIEFYAGELRVALLLGPRLAASYMLAVDPDALKLTRADYSTMIADIARSTRALYRFGGTSARRQVTVGSDAIDFASLELLRAHFDSFERSVSRIADQPVRSLRSRRVIVAVTKARRITEKEISIALRRGAWRPAGTDERNFAPRFVNALGDRWIPEIGEVQKTEHLDLYENRAILGFLRWLDRKIRSLTYKMSGLDIPDQAPVVTVWLGRLQNWRARLEDLNRRDLFSNLTPEQSLQSSSVFRADPHYGAAFRAMMKMRSGLGESGGEFRSLPLSRTYELYEIWCYIGLLDAVSLAYPHSQDSIRELLSGIRSDESLGVVLAHGETTKIDLSSRVQLYYQRRFATTPAKDGARTLVVDAIPDICLVSISASGNCEKIIVLDPKYRVGASLLDGIRDLHVYRDAILDPTFERLVVGAAALSPSAACVTFPERLPTVAPIALRLRPGSGSDGFKDLLALAVRSAA